MTGRIAILLDNETGAPVRQGGDVVAIPVPMTRTAHVSGNQVDVFHCFAGDERYLTPEGPKSFAETVGTVQKVLTGGEDAHGGQWVEAPIRNFGEQEIWELTLKRNQRTKVVRTTAGHRWLVGRPGSFRTVTTEHLVPGHRLAHLRPARVEAEASRDGVRQGVFFGDGSLQHRQYGQHSYGLITLWGEKAKDLAEYFEEFCPSQPTPDTLESGVSGLRFSSGMAGWSKALPDLNSDPSYLRGWLMGYIAADGSVDRHGKVSISSSVIENLEFVRAAALKLGIGTYGVSSTMRSGFGSSPSALHSVSFAGADLDPSWLLRQRHRDAYSAVQHGRDRFGWTVLSVERTDEIADVYCATVADTGSFALEDNIHTRNCCFCGSGDIIARSDMAIECGFCNSAFTVTVSPMYPAFPMSMNQQPYPWPGRPDGGVDPAMMGDPNAAAGADGSGFGGKLIPGGGADGAGGDADGDGNPFADDGDSGAAPQDGDDSGDTEAEVGGSKKPPFTKKKSSRMYRTASGRPVEPDDFLRHLAISTARDPNEMAARIKQERRR